MYLCVRVESGMEAVVRWQLINGGYFAIVENNINMDGGLVTSTEVGSRHFSDQIFLTTSVLWLGCFFLAE